MQNLESFLRLYEANNSNGRPTPSFKKIQIEASEKDDALAIFKDLFRGANGDYRIVGYSLYINNINTVGFVSV